MAGHHDLGLVLVALMVGAMGNWTCMALIARARHAAQSLRMVWISAAAIVFGSSVWALHFVAMLAMHMDFPISYDPALTALSIALGIGISFFGMAALAMGQSAAAGGLILAAGVGALHYTGMAAIDGPFRLHWNQGLVVGSLVVGALFAIAAMEAKDRVRAPYARAAATLLLTLGIGALHYTGMAAVRFQHDPALAADGPNFPPAALAVAVIAVTLAIVFIGMTSAYVDRYLETRRHDESARLKLHIAELEATRAELNLALAAAQAANASKSAFLANMSHELRTPLNAVIGFSELMVAEAFGPLGNARYKSYSADIRKSGAHLLSLINDILDISRLEAGKAELNESILDLAQLLRETRSMVETHAGDAGVVLSLDIPPGLPHLKADERRVKQILLNLLSNAIKFTPAGGTVAVAAVQERDGGLAVVIEDTGIGISKEDLPKAFESFGQIDNRLARRYEGSGLGLPLARHLAELHGGSLAIESEVDHGTRATLRFPAARNVAGDRGLLSA